MPRCFFLRCSTEANAGETSVVRTSALFSFFFWRGTFYVTLDDVFSVGVASKICARCYHGRKIKTIFGRTVLQRPAELKKKKPLCFFFVIHFQNKTKQKSFKIFALPGWPPLFIFTNSSLSGFGGMLNFRIWCIRCIKVSGGSVAASKKKKAYMFVTFLAFTFCCQTMVPYFVIVLWN
jgi:hypothetical protein